uniref:Solute carrier family 22 member 5-like n=1 Tax=Phallusia mammillata TaxID=59560 RepID=A0A6F9DSQ8_9ASCI|nr:solute carrier family 22 member 5-like [Phallusia mammillata]
MSEIQTTLEKFGRYQKRLCIILFVGALPSAFVTFQFLITHHQPSYYCNYGAFAFESNNETSSQEVTGASEVVASKSGNDTDSDRCHTTTTHQDVKGHTHNQTAEGCVFYSTHTSVVTEYDLVCQKAWVKPFLVAIFMVGMMLGGQCGGTLSDKFGRWKILFLASLWQLAATFLSSFAWNVPSYGFSIFLCGLPCAVTAQASTLIGSEFVSASKRGFTYFCIAAGFSVGYMVLPVTAYFIHDWRWWLRFITLAGVLTMPCIWLLDETPIWLVATGRNEEASKLLKRIRKYNRENRGTDLEEFEKFEPALNKEETLSVWSIMSSLARISSLLGRLLIVFFAWLVVNMTYYAIALNNDRLSGDWLWNMFFAGLVELASSLGFVICAQTVGRRNTYIALMTLTTFSLATTPFVASINGTAGVVFSMVSKFNVSTCFSIVYVYTGELFPTNVRHTILALSSAISRLGGILAPFIIYADEIGGSIASSIGMAVAIFVSALTFLYLPKTKDKALPQTLKDAKAMRSDIFLSCNREKESKTVVSPD